MDVSYVVINVLFVINTSKLLKFEELVGSHLVEIRLEPLRVLKLDEEETLGPREGRDQFDYARQRS